MNEFSGKYGLQSAITIWANFVTPVLLFALKQFQNKQDCGGTRTAVRLALVLKMFLLCHVVEAVYYLMKKALKMLASSVMMPASAVSGSSFLLLVNWFRNLQHQEAEHPAQEGDGGPAVLKLLLFVECISGSTRIVSPLCFENSK